MQKNLIALAVGATIAAAPIVATQADVKLWGRFEVEVVNIDGGDFDNKWEQGDANGMSRFGIDASKDLGNGLKAVGRYAFKMDPSNGSQLSARDQYVGLKGGWGAILLGRQPTPYKMNGGVKWDPFVATFMEARRSGGMSGDAIGHNGFVNDVIAYASPKFAGINFQVGYIADENATNNGTSGAANGTGLIGGTGVWGPVEVIAAYHNYRNRGVEDLEIEGGEDVKQMKAGIRWKGAGLTAAYQFEDVDAGGSVRINGNRVVRQLGEGKFNFINLGYKFGNTLIAGNWGAFSADGNANTDVDYWTIGAKYYFAKKVSSYIGYAETKTKPDNADDTKYKLFGVGMRYDF